MPFSLETLLRDHQGENYRLHDQAMNAQMVKVLRTIGFDQVYNRAEGPYLFNAENHRYLDLLSGFGVFALGRNHPKIKAALAEVLAADLPNLVQLDCSLLAGLLSKKLLTMTKEKSQLDFERVFYANSGAEIVEGAVKFARAATKRPKVVYCDHAFHGLTLGALSLNGDEIFREGFGPLLGGCEKIPFNDLSALEEKLTKKDVAAFVVEPIQGKGVNLPDENYLGEVSRLCKKHGSLLVIDEIQSGLGRTGRFLATDHWNQKGDVRPDIVTFAKALSGGMVPIGALVTKNWIFEKLFSRMDKAVVHGSTFGKNNLAMAAGLATLEVLEDERLIEKAHHHGALLLNRLKEMESKYELVKEVRGKGMMIGIEFGPPKKLTLKTAWKMLEKANKGLFCQMIIIPLFKRHRLLTQVAGHQSYVIKLIPSYTLNEQDIDWVVNGFDEVVADAHKFPGAIWELATNLAGHAIKGATHRSP